MAWQDQLRPASFRGATFEVVSASSTHGRRVAVHEFPRREKSATEDMGLARSTFTLAAFVVGDDWQARRDELLRACREPGPGILIHPTFGRLRVVCESCEEAEDVGEGRVATFSLVFGESGELAFPTGAVATVGVLADAADTLVSVATSDFFEQFEAGLGFIEEQVDYLRDEIVIPIYEQVQKPLAVISDVAGVIGALFELSDTIDDIIDSPDDLAEALVDVIGMIGDLGTYEFLVGSSGVFAGPPSAGSSTGDATGGNIEAIQRLVWRAALAGAATAASLETYTSYDDAIAVRDRLAERIASEAENASGQVYDALTDLRVALVEDITLRAADLARITEVTYAAEVSTLEVAYDLYEDSSRASEVEARNNVIHPGFVAGTLRVLER